MKKFIAIWDNTGLECILNVTKHEKEIDMWEKRKAWNILKGDKLVEPKPTLPLNQMVIRARANNQRHYEIYFFNSTISERDIRDMFENEPQIIVDWIRENGIKYFSDRVKTKDVVIV